MILTYQKNVILTFLKNILTVTIFFFSLILILNVLQEIVFFKNLEVNFFVPIYLTILNTSSIIFELEEISLRFLGSISIGFSSSEYLMYKNIKIIKRNIIK